MNKFIVPAAILVFFTQFFIGLYDGLAMIWLYEATIVATGILTVLWLIDAIVGAVLIILGRGHVDAK